MCVYVRDRFMNRKASPPSCLLVAVEAKKTEAARSEVPVAEVGDGADERESCPIEKKKIEMTRALVEGPRSVTPVADDEGDAWGTT